MEFKPKPGSLQWRVASLADNSGRSAKAISEDAGSSDLIRDLFRRPNQSPSLDTIHNLAHALKTTPEYLAYGISSPQPVQTLIPDRVELWGDVAAGIWREPDVRQEGARAAGVLIPPLTSYPADAQFDLLVKGTSLNRIAAEGDYLRCLSLNHTGLDANNGELVIVERKQGQEGRIETTAKRLRRRGATTELWPESDDPKWSAPLVLDKKRVKGGEAISIIAKVLFVFRDISHGR